MHYRLKKKLFNELTEILGLENTFPNFINFVSEAHNDFKSQFFLTYAINNEFYEMDTVNQKAFWFIFFNLMNFPNSNFVLNPSRRKMLKEKFSKPIPKQLNKLDRKPPDFGTKSIQNILKGLTKKGLITDTKNTNLHCYHREYKIATFSSDSDVKYKATHLLEEITKIRAILYERSLYWDESRLLEEIALDTVIRNILNHKINKVTDNSIRWIDGANFTARILFTTEGYLNVQNISDISRATLPKPTKNENKNVLTQTKEFIKITNLRLTKEQRQTLEKNYQELSKSYSLSEKDFNSKFRSIKGLGRSTKKALKKFFEEAKIK